VAVHAMTFAAWASTRPTMHAARGTPPDGRGAAALARALRLGPATDGVAKGQPQEVIVRIFSHPPPPVETAPTTACPPASTLTRSTYTRCSPFDRWRFRASTCAVKVRASLFAAFK
jgi:hypothetical protein